ncbi:hypothetical protein SAMN05878482_108106 [Peribacillus simplex]|uniref:Uncharacterized protein n=1 Tax=Peribacillus simplex TaxID=1478 RepID=A0A9X8RDB6_9BACI|nr:hypothetical protein SAMN05878482_108106 [Peribacillus simplex]
MALLSLLAQKDMKMIERKLKQLSEGVVYIIYKAGYFQL